MFFQGGGFQLVILPLGLVAMLFALIIPLAIGFAKWRLPASTALLGPVGVVALGMVGTLMGMQMAHQAIGYAPPEMQETMWAQGASVALYTTLLAVMLAIPAAVIACFAGAVPAVIAVGPEPRVDVRGLLSAAGGAVGSFIVAVIAVVAVVGVNEIPGIGLVLPIGLAICLVVTLLTVVACGRIASDDQLHQGRVAGSRFFVALCGALALILLAEFFRTTAQSSAAGMMAQLSPELQSLLVSQGMRTASSVGWFGWLLALVPMTAGTCGALHWVKRIDGRVGIGAVIALVSVVLMVVMIYASRAASVHQVTGLW